jgi:intracellular septation protein
MHPALEFLPLAAFLAAFWLGDIYVATAALMITMPMMWLIGRLRTGRSSDLHAISTVLVLVFGSLTLLWRDQRFIQWKPTVLFAALAVVFLASAWIGRRTLTERLMGAALQGQATLAPADWQRLNLAWVGFYAAMALLNWAVVANATVEQWVAFKAFGITGATLIFALAQGVWIMRRGAGSAPS